MPVPTAQVRMRAVRQAQTPVQAGRRGHTAVRFIDCPPSITSGARHPIRHGPRHPWPFHGSKGAHEHAPPSLAPDHRADRWRLDGPGRLGGLSGPHPVSGSSGLEIGARAAGSAHARGSGIDATDPGESDPADPGPPCTPQAHNEVLRSALFGQQHASWQGVEGDRSAFDSDILLPAARHLRSLHAHHAGETRDDNRFEASAPGLVVNSSRSRIVTWAVIAAGVVAVVLLAGVVLKAVLQWITMD